jgi:hypothetical protein
LKDEGRQPFVGLEEKIGWGVPCRVSQLIRRSTTKYIVSAVTMRCTMLNWLRFLNAAAFLEDQEERFDFPALPVRFKLQAQGDFSRVCQSALALERRW